MDQLACPIGGVKLKIKLKIKLASIWIMAGIIFALTGISPLQANAGSLQEEAGHLLASGTAKASATVKWIDSVKLPGYAKKFYQALEESTDHDGKKDYLILDQYFKPGNAKSSVPEKPKLYQVTRTKTETSMLAAKYEGNWKAEKTDPMFQNIRTAFELFELDHPEVFWLCSENDLKMAAITTHSQGKDVTYIRVDLKRFGADSFDMRRDYRQKSIRSDISKMKKRVKQIEAGMPDGGIYEKVKYFNNWLTRNNDEYYSKDGGSIPDRNGRSLCALLGGTGKKGPVAKGYAYALKVLCDRAGIPCMTVLCTEFSHAWNYVQIGRLWYAVDVAWNDPGVTDWNGRRTEAASGYEWEYYLLAGTDTKDCDGKAFKEDHSVKWLKYALPAGITLSKKKYADSGKEELPDADAYVSGFYKMLEESTDNDGTKDYLIRDEYFATGNEKTEAKDMELYQIVHAADHVWMLVGKVPGGEEDARALTARLARVYSEFGVDHPEVFWLCGWGETKFPIVVSSSSGQKISYLFLTLKNTGDDSYDIRGDYTEKSIRADIGKMDRSVKNILKDMPDGSTAQKVRYFNQWITKHNSYCTNADEKVPFFSSKSISALLGSTGAQGPVCTGYAGAFKVLCDRAGIPCLFAVGSMGKDFHAWNYVQIGQLWYAVDVTWNDVIVVGKDGSRQTQADSGYESEEYLLAGSETKNSKGRSFVESHEMESTQIGQYVSAFAPYAELSKAEWSKTAYTE